jgi:hypothetical protein
MSSDATPVSSPEGLRFDEPAAGTGAPICGRCQAAIADAYYEVNGHVVCPGCKTALEQSPTGSSASRMLRATAFGLGGAIVGAGIYYAILAATGYEIGLVAIAVGWLVGRGVQKGSHGMGGWTYQALAVGLTYLAIVSTYVPFIVKAVTADEAKPSVAASVPAASAPAASAPAARADTVTVDPTPSAAGSDAAISAGQFALGVVGLLALAAAAPFLAGFENVLGILIIGFALYQAWQMNRRMPMTINGPYAVGRGTGAAGGE